MNQKQRTRNKSGGLITAKEKTEGETFDQRELLLAEAAHQSRDMLLLHARRITACREDAEDIVQEAYLNALKGLRQFRGDSTMETWLYSIMKNAAIEHLRNRKRHGFDQRSPVRSESDEEIMVEIPETRANPEDACAQSEMKRILHSEIDNLAPGYRHTVQMCLLDEIPYRIAAESMHVALSTVKSRAIHSRRILRKALCRHFLTSPMQHHLITNQSEDL